MVQGRIKTNLTFQLERQFETTLAFLFLSICRLANFLAEDSRVVPGETQIRVRGVSTEGAKRLGSFRIIIEKDVSFFAFDECQYIDVLRHLGGPPFASLTALNAALTLVG